MPHLHPGSRRIVVTGGPGAGKTTLLEALERLGYRRSLEAGRAIIQDQVAIGGGALPWQDPLLFAELMLCWEMRSYRMTESAPGIVFFDRGIPDVIGYLRTLGRQAPPHMEKAAALCRYDRRVFIAPPWPEIFAPDDERRQTLAEAERTYEAMVETYRRFGYDLVPLPRSPVVDRAQFVIAQLN